MKYISIGDSCVIAYHLRRLKLNVEETGFFDYVLTSMTTVVQALTTKDIVQALDTNVEFEGLFEGHRVAYCRNFDYFQSIHDLPPNGNDPTVFRKQLVDKYARRHTRLLQTLNKENDIKFVFHSNKTVNTTAIHLFVHTLFTEFPLVRFHLFVVTTQPMESLECDRVTMICLQDYKLSNPPTNPMWYLNQYDWESVFNKIVTETVNDTMVR